MSQYSRATAVPPSDYTRPSTVEGMNRQLKFWKVLGFPRLLPWEQNEFEALSKTLASAETV